MNWGGFPAAHGPICVIRPWLYQAFLSTKTRLSVENEDTGEECLALCLTIEAGCEVDDNDWLHAISSSQLPPNSSDHSSSPALISPARHQHRSSVNVRNTASRGRHSYTGTGEVSHLVISLLTLHVYSKTVSWTGRQLKCRLRCWAALWLKYLPRQWRPKSVRLPDLAAPTMDICNFWYCKT